MGEHDVEAELSDRDLRRFMTAILADVRALELMLEKGMIESGVRRIGAEQEMFLVGRDFRPAPLAVEALEIIDDPAFVTELARFNLECNLQPYEFKGKCLSRMEDDLRGYLDGALDKLGDKLDVVVLLTGILPTLTMEDLGLENMTPNPRYYAMNNACVKMRGGHFETRIKGIDELFATHDNVMLESCNTSFQLHYQTSADEFRDVYNLSQMITAPLLAGAANSAVLLGRRLWHETRVALFQHSVDARSEAHQIRGGRPRVSFGDGWVRKSVIELFKEDIARFRVVLATDVDGDPVAQVERGEAPSLAALRLHNGTVYRWNRPCYGVADGIAHLRVENRVLPAGPTVLDEMANAAFFYGLMAAGPHVWGDVTRHMAFDDAKANFIAAARLGLRAQFTWTDGHSVPAVELIREQLLPMAREGLVESGVDADDADRYLGVLRDRVNSGRTGAQWTLDSLAQMKSIRTPHERMRVLTAATHERQKTSLPVHEWELARHEEVEDWRPSYERVGQFMTTDLFTVRPQDVVDLAASLMDWERIRHIPVESDDGKLVGLVSHRTLIRLLVQGYGKHGQRPIPVRDIMKPNPITVGPRTRTLEAIEIMRAKKVGCLPIVDNGRLVGLITERDLVNVSSQLLEEQLRLAIERRNRAEQTVADTDAGD